MIMRRILFAILGIMTTLTTWGVGAYPLPVDVRQSDGTTLTILLHGDEDFHYYTTSDGVLLVQQDGAYYIGAVDDMGQLTATRQLAHNRELRTPQEKQLAEAQQRETFLNAGRETAAIHKARREPIDDTGTTLFPHQGSPKAVVILAEFSDTTFTIENPKRSFDEYFNATTPLPDHGFGENQNASSVHQYFKNVSFGKYTPSFDVYGPVTLPSALKTYGGTLDNGRGERMDLLFQDACALMNDSLDFSQYDADNDGNVDLVIIIYAGYSEAFNGNSHECIWPKSGTTSGGTYDGKRVSRYAVGAELVGFPGCYSSAPYKRIHGIGVMCHEFCHTLGLPDFYPTLQSSKGDNQAMEYWSLMDSGSYLINSYSPCALTAWEREAFGWIDIPTLTESGDLSIKALDDGGTAYRILNDNDPEGREYFIIENIQNIGHNYRQKGHGLLVYHVEYDPTAFSLSSNNVNNNVGHPRFTVVPADGKLFCAYNVGKIIDGVKITNSIFYANLAGDPFPGTAGITALNDTMGIVNFQVYTGEKLNKALDNITEDPDDNSKGNVINLSYIHDFELGITTPELTAKDSDTSIYTIDGRMVGKTMDRLPKGIYIRQGKKVVKL